MRAVVLSLLLLAIPLSAHAESPPEELVKVRTAFATAVANNDIKAAIDLTNFPLKNTVFAAPPTIPLAGFKRQFKMYMEMKSCLKTEPLEPPTGKGAKSWAINCDGNVFHFALIKGRWLHSEYENINE